MFLDDIDFTKLKLPIEPQNLVYIYLAYKLINNLDKIQIGTGNSSIPNMHSMPRMPGMPSMPNMMNRPPKLNGLYSLFMFLILLTFGFMIFSNLLNRVSISAVTMEPTEIKIPNKFPKNMTGCPIKNSVQTYMNKCPMGFESMDKDKYNEMLQKCPVFKSEKKEDQ